ncbi:MAG: MFS transporter [Gemmatimonadales bacterium]
MRTYGSAPRERHLLRDTNLHVIFGITLMAVLGVSTVTPVLPRIAYVFGNTPQTTGLLIAAFTLPGIFFTPVLGVLGDRVGRKKVLVPSLVLFAVAGTACGFARQFNLLLGLRFLQGIGASSLGALNVTMVADLFAGHDRSAAMGYNASVLSIGTGLYPAIGGSLALLGWYYPFFLPLLALPVALAVLLALDNPEPEAGGSLREYIAVTLKAVWQPQVLALFASSVITFVLIYGSFLTYFPFLLTSSYAASPAFIGLVMSLASVATAITAFKVGTLSERFGSRILVKVGFALYVVALAGIPFARSLWSLALPILLFGVANGLNIPSIMTILTGFAPSEYRAAFMALNGTLLRLGQTLGPVIVGVAVQAFGMSGSFVASSVLALAMLLGLMMVLRTTLDASGSNGQAAAQVL